MARKLALGVVTALLLMTIMALAGDEAPWFDMQNCSMCKPMSSTPGFMEHVTWEQAKISNGFVSVSSVTPDFVKQYKEANAKMDKIGEKLMAGEQMYLCGSCQKMGSFIMGGAHMEQVELANGGVMILTSDNPEVVTQMHAYVDKNKAEMKKMMSAMPAKEGTK